MLVRICMLLVALIVAVGVVEYVWDLPPLEQIQLAATVIKTGKVEDRTIVRLGIASWQLEEFPWEETIARYERANPDIHITMSALPEGFMNTMNAYWRHGHTRYDVIVAWADEEITPFIQYKWNNPAERSLLVNVREYLTDEQFDRFLPGLCVGSSRADPDNPGRRLYFELPWMGEVLALNYNRMFFKMAGVEKPPRSWDEVEAVCKKLKGLKYKGRVVAPLAMNFSQTIFFGQNCYIPMLAAYKQGRGVADEKGRLDVSSPEAARVFETLKRWYRAKYISKNCMVNDTVEEDFKFMRAAMFPHWQSRGLEAIREARKIGAGADAIGVAPTPGAATCGTLVSTYGCIIPRCSPVIEEAVRFSYEAFATDKHGFQTAVTRAGKLPSVKELYDRQDLPRMVLDLGESLKNAYFFPDLTNWPQCALILSVEFQKYLDENISAAKALENVRRRFAEEVYEEE